MRPVKSSIAYTFECCKVLCTDGYCGQRWLFFPCCCLCCCALAMHLYVTSRCCGRVVDRLAAFATAHPILHLFMHQCRHCTRYKHSKRPAGCAGRSWLLLTSGLTCCCTRECNCCILISCCRASETAQADQNQANYAERHPPGSAAGPRRAKGRRGPSSPLGH